MAFLIRDALPNDIAPCLALDHSYETEHVWRMSITTPASGWQVSFQRERLPRRVQATHHVPEIRLHQSLASDMCYLVAETKQDAMILGYLTMRLASTHQLAFVQDIVVGKDFRRAGIGSRMLSIARRWAIEHDAEQLLVETTTRNYPAVNFLQNRGLAFCGFNDQYYRSGDIAIFFGQTLR